MSGPVTILVGAPETAPVLMPRLRRVINIGRLPKEIFVFIGRVWIGCARRKGQPAQKKAARKYLSGQQNRIAGMPSLIERQPERDGCLQLRPSPSPLRGACGRYGGRGRDRGYSPEPIPERGRSPG